MESVLNEVRSTNVVPAFASFNESALFAVNYIEEEYTNILMDIGIQELAIYENKLTDGIKDFWNKIVEFVKNIWATIKEMFEKLLDIIKKFAKENFDKLSKIFNGKVTQKDIEAAAKKLDKDFSYEGYEYGLGNNINLIKGELNKYFDDMKKLAEDKAINSKNKLGAKAGQDIKEEVNAIEEKFNTAIASRLGVSSANVQAASDLKSAIDNKLKGEKKTWKKDDVVVVAGDIYKFVFNYEEAKKAISDSYKKSKKEIDQLLKDTKKAEVFDNKNNNKDGSKEFRNVMLKAIKKVGTTNQLIAGAVTSAFKNKYNQNKAILAKILKKVEIKESYENNDYNDLTESVSFQSELATLFNF